MYHSMTSLQCRDDKAGGKNISKQYSTVIHISHDSVPTGAWDDYRSVRVLRQILKAENITCKRGNRIITHIVFLLLNLYVNLTSKFYH